MDLVDKAVYIEHGTIQKIYSGNEFRALDDNDRIRLGLRCFTLDNQKEIIPTQSKDGDFENLQSIYQLRPKLYH